MLVTRKEKDSAIMADRNVQVKFAFILQMTTLGWGRDSACVVGETCCRASLEWSSTAQGSYTLPSLALSQLPTSALPLLAPNSLFSPPLFPLSTHQGGSKITNELSTAKANRHFLILVSFSICHVIAPAFITLSLPWSLVFPQLPDFLLPFLSYLVYRFSESFFSVHHQMLVFIYSFSYLLRA